MKPAELLTSFTEEELQAFSGPDHKWDFESNPHHFPIYLFLLFGKKYCEKTKLSRWQEDFFNLHVVICPCDLFALPKPYALVMCISSMWNASTTLIFFIGKMPFDAVATYTGSSFFGKGAVGVSQISISAMMFDGQEVQVENSARLLGDSTEGFKILGALNTLAGEINKEREKANFFHNVKAEV